MAKRSKLTHAILIRLLLVSLLLLPMLGYSLYRIFFHSMSETYIDSVRGSLYEYARTLELQVGAGTSADRISALLDDYLLHSNVLAVQLTLPSAADPILPRLGRSTAPSDSPIDNQLFQNDDLRFVQSTPLYLGGELGTLKAEFDESSIRRQLLRATLLGSLVLLLFGFFLLLFTYLQIRTIAKSATSLKNNAERVANGEQDVRLDLTTPILEFGGMADSIESMRSSLIEQQRALQLQVLQDPLTGVGNRLALDVDLKRALHRLSDKGEFFALLLLDVDDFKEVNDSHGHPVGDRLIRFIATRLKRLVAATGATVVRMGGDEFSLAVPVTSHKDCFDTCQAIMHRLNRVIVLRGRRIELNLSIGAALVNRPMSQEEVIKRADIALYAAKQSRRNQIRLFDDQLMQLENRREALLESIKAQDYLDPQLGISLRFQPKYDLQSLLPVGLEALVMWNHPNLGHLKPDEFIPLAEQEGLLNKLTQHIIETACSHLANWKQQLGVQIPMAINISPVDLRNSFFVHYLLEAFNRAGISPNLVELEVTEHALVEDYDTARTALLKLGEAGFSIAIDDFGVGYSNLANLQNLPVRTIKIDRMFIQSLSPGSDQYLIVGAIIDLSLKLGIRTVAEGVENEATPLILRHLGCNEAQGEWLSDYLGADEVPVFWAASQPGGSRSGGKVGDSGEARRLPLH